MYMYLDNKNLSCEVQRTILSVIISLNQPQELILKPYLLGSGSWCDDYITYQQQIIALSWTVSLLMGRGG